jgi:cellulose synthase/poly-beta-1,6-N-acetylglucosamine synthase-like glycosyltransferase
MWGTYPRLEIIVVDDGSSDDMATVASDFARNHPGVRVLRKPRRGGKSSALNFALAYCQADIIVGVDADSQVEPNTLWEIVQPFADPRVGAVSGTVLARNAHANLVAWLQAFEYLTCIFVGRLLAARLGVLGIVSGALGAFRRSALLRVEGWDVGPGEDSDLTLKLRKAGYRIALVPYAQCLTNVPTTWRRWINQRRRWSWATVTFDCRKHVDLANPLSPNFRLTNLLVLLDRWSYNVVLPFGIWAYLIWTLVFERHEHTWKQYLLYYLVYVVFETIQAGAAIYYSNDRRRDVWVSLALPLMPFYQLLLKLVTIVAIVEEIAWRRSFRDSFVPTHVREATWHW